MLSQPSHKVILGSRFEVEVDLGDHPKLHHPARDGSDTRRMQCTKFTGCTYRSFADGGLLSFQRALGPQLVAAFLPLQVQLPLHASHGQSKVPRVWSDCGGCNEFHKVQPDDIELTCYPDVYLLMAARGQDTIETNEISLKEKFFRYFQHEITGICPHHATSDTRLIVVVHSNPRANGSSRRHCFGRWRAI